MKCTLLLSVPHLSTPNMMVLAKAIARAAEGVTFACGLAEPWAPPMAALGTQGFTSGLINLLPQRSVAVRDALRAGDFRRANAEIAAMELFEALRAEEQNGCNVSVVKAALGMAGDDVGAARAPAAWPLPPGSLAALRNLLEGWRLIRQSAAE